MTPFALTAAAAVATDSSLETSISTNSTEAFGASFLMSATAFSPLDLVREPRSTEHPCSVARACKTYLCRCWRQ